MNHPPPAYQEHAFMFQCEGESLIGIATSPGNCAAPESALVIVVGGPQYRIGSHRQFVELARVAAAQGWAALRFDYRGMGDSWAAARSFENVEDDIRAAIDALCLQLPSIRRVVLWGLCDGASAACLYAPLDERVQGLILVNPWVHTPVGQAVTKLKHYYLKRLRSGSFWKSVLRGKLNFLQVARDLGGLGARLLPNWRRSKTHADRSSSMQPLPQRMACSLRESGLPFAVLLSGQDHVAREFQDIAWQSQHWKQLKSGQLMAMEHIPHANHTLATPHAQREMHGHVRNWLGRLKAAVASGIAAFFSWECVQTCLEFTALRV